MPQELDQKDQAVAGGTSTGEAQATGQGTEVRQPGGKVDLTSLPEFREWQAAADRRAAAAEYAAEQARRAAAQLEAQYHQDQMARLEGEDRLKYELGLLQRQNQALQQQRELDLYALQRQRDLEDIVRETGVDMKEIINAPNVHDAWRIGQAHLKKSFANPPKLTREQEIEREADDRVDLPPSTKGMGIREALQTEYDRALDAGELGAMLAAMAKADKAGVKLKE